MLASSHARRRPDSARVTFNSPFESSAAAMKSRISNLPKRKPGRLVTCQSRVGAEEAADDMTQLSEPQSAMLKNTQMRIEQASHRGTASSTESTPEQEEGAEAVQELAQQPNKRKSGRKPVYATCEERKQHSEQTRAAFREQRTEYIKQLEATIQQIEDTLARLQQSQRAAADECVILRYENSLLGMILLEKGASHLCI
ncbi:hypothetical protein LTR59_014735 [Friedmanniomyces endolithicus]|nr:hypothetical protein LTR94_017486 [Friedmanniomyces endolithicus]KAK0774872.1 hypothetical protein LTR59_014735 [Friedmanniomyces endolithicus]KAK0778992.1 hypothetical protein LTR38_014604 [Friedmanniomyces endolithicus]KAK0782777.1 hypothetical protein LTR75_014316 [Friedmanniomyces endolithicus]